LPKKRRRLLALVPGLMLTDGVRAGDQPPDAERLIQQLDSPSFPERDTSSNRS
jgi:hypothetical protein